MQCVEGTESESGKRASPIRGRMARGDGDSGGFKPQSSGESPVFAWIPLVLEIVSRRAYETERPSLNHIQDRSHRLRLSSDSLDRCVVEWTFEAADVEVGDLAHVVIVLFRAHRWSRVGHRPARRRQTFVVPRAPLREAEKCRQLSSLGVVDLNIADGSGEQEHAHLVQSGSIL